MKFNILISLILLSGSYTTVLCVRNQDGPQTLGTSSLDSSGLVSGPKLEGDLKGPKTHQEVPEVKREESPGQQEALQVQETQVQEQHQAPDTESETKVLAGSEGQDVTLPKVEGDLKGPAQDPLKTNLEQQLEPASGERSLTSQEGLGGGVNPEGRPNNTEELGESGSSSSKPTTPKQEPALNPKPPVEKGRETLQQKTLEEHPTNQLTEGTQLPSTKTEQTISQLPGPPEPAPVLKRPEVPVPVPAPKVPEPKLPEAPPAKPPVAPPLESRTKEVVIKPVVNPTPNPPTDKGQPTTELTPRVTAQDTPTNTPNATQETSETDKDNQVKEVLLASLKEMQTNFDTVNSTELVQPPADKVEAVKKSLCESFKTDLVNVCTASGQNSSQDLLTLVNNYYRNNVCTTEHSLNQLFNKDGDFAYKLLTNHLSQFSKKAPNKNTQDVYDKSVPVVKKLTELMKDAELALVSDKVKTLLEKRNLILTSALCAVANADQNVMASAQFESGQVTLTVNQEDYIKETTEVLMKAYAPMADLLKQFNTLLPKLLDIFEEGFENKINMLTSLANSRKTPAQPGVTSSGSAPGNTGTTTSGAGSGTGPSPPSTSTAATGPLQTSQTTRPAAASAAVSRGTTADTGSSTTRSTLLQFIGDDNREVAAVHGHPSLIQKFKSLLQVSTSPSTSLSPDPAQKTTSPKEPAPTTPKEPVPEKPTTQEQSGQPVTGHNSGSNVLTTLLPGSRSTTQANGPDNRVPEQGAGGVGPAKPGTTPTGEAGTQGVKGPQVDVNSLNGMQVLERTTTGGVVTTDHSRHQLATSGQSSALAKLGLDAVSRAEADAEVTGAGPLGLLTQIKTKLKALVSRGGSEAPAAGNPAAQTEEALKKQRDVEKEQQLFDEAMKQFMHLGMFKTAGGKLVAELDEQKVKALVRANLLTLNDFDSVYNLVVGPQRSLHSLYMFMEHMLLSPDADEKIKHLEDSKLLERIKKMVNPLEDLYEQIKANVPRLTLRRPSLGPDSELEAPARPSGEAPAEHVNRRGKFLLVSNSSGVNLSDHNLLIKLNKIIQNLSTRSGFKVSERRQLIRL